MAAIPALALLVVACGGAPDDEGAPVDGATGSSDAAEVASGGETTGGQSGTGTSDASGRTAPDQQADDGQDGPPDQKQDDADQDGVAPQRNRESAEEVDPFEELEWALTPAGPESPSVNEDSIYRVLDDLDPEACQRLVSDPADGWFDPGAFGTGERSVHLFRAGALLCAGDVVAADAAYRQAVAFSWPLPVTQPLHSRVCNVWDAVTRMLDPEAGPCVLEELAVDDATTAEADDDEASDGASSEGASEEPTDTEGSADTHDPDPAGEPTVTDDPADALSEDDTGP